MSVDFKNPKLVGLILGPVLFVLILLIQPAGLDGQVVKVIAVATFMITWWISEAVSLSVTALIPIILLPTLGVTTMSETTEPYANPIIYLFMGGFIIAIAMEKWNLHRRIALNIIRLTGTGSNGVILGFMLATYLLSMWISNTATTVMMLPIALSVINLLFDNGDQEIKLNPKEKNFALGLMLGIAFAANVGGTSTLIGTPPNAVFAGFFNQRGVEIGFLNWMMVGVPFSLIMIAITYLMITRVFYPGEISKAHSSHNLIKDELAKMGSISKQETRVLIIFASTAILWISKTLILDLFPQLYLHDSIIAMLGGLLLFIIPAGKEENSGLLKWEDTKRLPWGILVLFGGGLSLAKAMEKTGIIDMIANQAAGFTNVENWIIVLALTAVVLFMTELMSNIALITVFLPVLLGISTGLGFDPLVLCIPATLASSAAFMLPMATPPNAIVFASGHIKVYHMVKIGFILNIIVIILLTLMYLVLIPKVF